MHEFDACVVKAWGDRRIFFRGLLLSGDLRSSLFLVQVQRELETLFGPTRFTMLRYPSGLAAKGEWIQKRSAARAKVFYAHERWGNAYHVEDQGNLIACICVSPVDLRRHILFSLLDAKEFVPYQPKPFSLTDLPEGFPDTVRHPGRLS